MHGRGLVPFDDKIYGLLAEGGQVQTPPLTRKGYLHLRKWTVIAASLARLVHARPGGILNPGKKNPTENVSVMERFRWKFPESESIAQNFPSKSHIADPLEPCDPETEPD